MKPISITPEEALIGAYRGGVACRDKYGKEHYRELGRKSAAGRARKLDRESVRRAKLRRDAGETLREIAVSLGVSVRTLRRELAS